MKARADGVAYANLKVGDRAGGSPRDPERRALAEQGCAGAPIEVERTKAEKWNGQLPRNVYAGAPVPFMQVH